MNRPLRNATSLGLCLVTLVAGCAPTQPFYFGEDGDLSHYMDVATDIEYPDVDSNSIEEVTAAQPPITLDNAGNYQMWDLTLEEATRITLTNSQVIRSLGGRISDFGQNISTTTPEALTLGGAANVATSYDPALIESGYGGNTGSPLSGTGVEAALSEFDAQLDSSIIWQNNDRPQNFGLAAAPDFFNPRFRQDIGRYSTGLTKNVANGGTFEFRNNINYDQNNNGSRTQPSDWFVNFEAAVTQPLLQGAGTQYNRIAGPRSFQEFSGGFSDQFDGVIIQRLRTDIALTDFEVSVRDLMRDVEDAYWELYFAYRDLESRKVGLESASATWAQVIAKVRTGSAGGEADKEAQARTQYFLFRSQVETALTNLLRVENRLRFLMGISASDTRLIRPSDEPTVARVHFDWATVHTEALARREEVRRQKWQIKRRELELIAAKNQILPRLDLVGRYRWLGAGDELLNSQRNGIPPFLDDSNAFESLTSGDFQEWETGIQLNMPLGFRRGLTTVRHHQLLLARERAILEDLELTISHQMVDAIRDIDFNFQVAQSNFNRRAATEDEVVAIQAIFDVGRVTVDILLDAQRRRSEAESAFYRSLVDYNRAVMRLHHRKGSLLEYNGVYLAEGPWPGKAYFDAMRRARQRDASLFLDYGFTRPNVLSRGPHAQMPGTSTGVEYQGTTGLGPLPPAAGSVSPTPATGPTEEPIPPPTGEPLGMIPTSGIAPVAYFESLPQAAPLVAASPLTNVAAPASSVETALPANPFVQVSSTTPDGSSPVASPATSPAPQPLAPYALPTHQSGVEGAANASSGRGW